MKKIHLLVCLILLVAVPGMARVNNVYLDGMGLYGSMNDAGKTNTGFGLGLGYEIVPNAIVSFRAMNSSSSKIIDSPLVGYNDYTNEYESTVFAVTVEYDYQIVKNMPLFWINTLGGGMADVSINEGVWNAVYYRFDEIGAQEKGIYGAFWTGARYDLTQHVGFFALAGYQKVFGFTQDLKDASVGGYQIMAGVTITVWGENASLYDGY